MPCIRETYTEDNDTEEEESTEEEEDEEEVKKDPLAKMKTAIEKRKMRDLKKGFVVFLDQERKDLDKYVAIKKA